MNDDRPPQAPEGWQRVHLWQIQAVRDLLLIAAAIGVVWLGYVLSAVTVPLLVALGLAYLVEPLVAWLMRAVPGLGRRGAVLSMMAIMAVSLVLGLVLTVPLVVGQARELMRNSDRYLERARGFAADRHLPPWLQEGLGTIADFLPKRAASAPMTDEPPVGGEGPAATTVLPVPAGAPLDEARVRALVREELQRQERPAMGSALKGVASGGMQVLGFVGGVVGDFAGLAIFLFVCGFCFFFFSTAFPAVRGHVASFLPREGEARWRDLIAKMDRAISGFVRGRLTICAIMGAIYAIGWTLCGVPHSLLLGLAIGVCGLVPYLSAIGLPLAWAFLLISLGGGQMQEGFYVARAADGVLGIVWWKVLLLPALVNVIAQVVEDYVLNPLIQGKATNLHPATILLACIAGGSLAGLYGMILAIPVTACLKILIDDVLMPRLSQWLAGKRGDPLPL
jgi:predicted PurR-regulated permease PerM